MHPALPYGGAVQGRSIGSDSRGNWAAYAAAVRDGTGLGKTEFGRRIEVDRGTVHRWETGQTRPSDPEILERFAATFGLPIDDVLAAAGLRRDIDVPAEPEPDPDVAMILASDLPDRIKRELIAHVTEQRERDEQRRVDEIRRMIRIAGGRVA
jgi:transcriptional regulator with XRE-family HTH domain